MTLNKRASGKKGACYYYAPVDKKIAQSVAIVKPTTLPVAAGVEYKAGKGWYVWALELISPIAQ